MNVSTRFLLRIPDVLFHEMIAHAEQERPLECCGLLAGTKRADDLAVVTQRYPLRNELASPTEFSSDPTSMLMAVKDMRAKGADILAVYHSHPSSAPVPSKRDLERNYSIDVMNLIIGWFEGAVDVRGWWLTATSYVSGQFQTDSAFPN